MLTSTSAGLAVAHRVSRYEHAARLCAGIAIAIGLAVLGGWLFSIGTLTSLVPGWVAMQPSTACCMVLAGVSLQAAGKARTGHVHKLRLGAALIVFVLALLTLLQYLWQIDIGTDRLFGASAAVPAEWANARAVPGRMAIATATNFLLTSAALAALDSRVRFLSPALALTAMAISMLAILGYLYGVDALYGIGFFSTVALHSALGNLLLGTGVLLIRPAQGAVAILVSDWAGGALARRMLPVAVAAPLLLGWLGVEGQRLHLYEAGFGVALTALAYITLFTLFTWRMAHELQHTEQLRANAETTRHEQALQLDGLIESAMDAIVMLDEAQLIIVFNPSAEIMFGHARADVLGRSLEMLMPQRFRSGHAAQVLAFGGAGSTARRMGSLGTVTAIRADGTEFPVEASISISHPARGMCYTAIVRDITDRVRAEQEMVSVVAGSVAKSSYITYMTHELRTPLNTILGYAQIIERSAPAPAHLAPIRHIIKAGWHLRDLITEVQDLAIPEARSAGLSSHTILIDGVIDEVCGMLKPLLAEADLRITVGGAVGLTLHANPVRLKQILLNLLSNAIKYNRAGGAIHIARAADGNAQVRIGIRDGGHGLTALELASLFQPFNRLGQEGGQQVGTGVGLVVTRKLVESMGGTIGVESEPGAGSLFWFTLPAALPG